MLESQLYFDCSLAFSTTDFSSDSKWDVKVKQAYTI